MLHCTFLHTYLLCARKLNEKETEKQRNGKTKLKKEKETKM
jgi:hypothetical protein